MDRQRVQFPGDAGKSCRHQGVGRLAHICYSVDASQPGVTGKTVTSFDGSAVTQYPDYASWFNANETVNGLKFPASKWRRPAGRGRFVGRIAAVALFPARSASSRRRSLPGNAGGSPAAALRRGKYRHRSPSQAVALEQTLAGRIAALTR
ncbi:MAG: hypothetical protein ACLRI7_10245 [Ruthenibacterium lactatiformans]